MINKALNWYLGNAFDYKNTPHQTKRRFLLRFIWKIGHLFLIFAVANYQLLLNPPGLDRSKGRWL
jgi:hypothetical protein